MITSPGRRIQLQSAEHWLTRAPIDNAQRLIGSDDHRRKPVSHVANRRACWNQRHWVNLFRRTKVELEDIANDADDPAVTESLRAHDTPLRSRSGRYECRRIPVNLRK